jgi:MFS family permease
MSRGRTAFPIRLNLSLFFAVGSYSTLQSIVIPVLPQFASRFDAPPQDAAWLVSGFLMVGASVTPVAGRLGDLYGHVRVLLVVLGIFAAGTVLGILAPTMAVLIAARMVQGLGAAAIALSFSIIKNRYPPHRGAAAVGMLSATMAAAAGLGLSLSGILSATFGLTTVFVLPLCVSVTSIILLIPQLKNDQRVPLADGHINWGGGVLFTIGMFLVLLAITQGNSWHWLSPATLLCFAGGLLVLGAWAVVELRARNPLVDVRLLVSRRLARINLSTLLVGMVMFSTYTMMPIFLQAKTIDGVGLGLGVIATGFVMLPVSIMNFASGSLAGPTTSAIGSRNMLVLGVSINAVGLIFIAFFHDIPGEVIVMCVLHGAGVGLAFAAMPALTLQAVRHDQVGVAAGLYNTLRSIGGAIGTQVAFALLASSTGSPTGANFRSVLIFLGCIGAAALAAALSIPRTLVDESEKTL